MAAIKECQYCHAGLSRDEVSLNKKIFESDSKRGKFSCLTCMSEILETTVEELNEKIQEFKTQGCKLFG